MDVNTQSSHLIGRMDGLPIGMVSILVEDGYLRALGSVHNSGQSRDWKITQGVVGNTSDVRKS